MKAHVVDLAFKGVDLNKPETCSGIAVGLRSLADFLLAAQDVVDAMDKAKERGQKIEPTRLRLTLLRFRATMPRIPGQQAKKETEE